MGGALCRSLQARPEGVLFFMFIVYVLYSAAFNKIYVGCTSDLEGRLMSHNFLGKKGYTVRFRPWALIYSEVFETKSGALEREKELKSSQGRKFIWGLVEKKRRDNG